MANVYDFEAQTIDGHTVALSDYQGKVLLIVNTASACGHQEFASQGLVVLGFPCNQFGSQDPGSNEEIGAFCQKNYGVSFPMMAKTEVNGAQAHPLYQWLKGQAPGLLGSEGIKWNFTKFLVAKDGTTVKRYGSMDTPASVSKDIAAALAI
ncbi:MAG: glutathione peroxidase [Betaproteobacteria bacterium]|nr:glutathione peroxidase [Betaproteobacteria bacterium]